MGRPEIDTIVSYAVPHGGRSEFKHQRQNGNYLDTDATKVTVHFLRLYRLTDRTEPPLITKILTHQAVCALHLLVITKIVQGAISGSFWFILDFILQEGSAAAVDSQGCAGNEWTKIRGEESAEHADFIRPTQATNGMKLFGFTAFPGGIGK